MVEDVAKVFSPKNFWTDVLSVWCELNFDTPITVNEIKNQVLWYNSNIRIQGKPVMYRAMYEKGIIYVKDLLSVNNTFVSISDLQRKYGNFPFTQYIGLLSSLPINWKRTLQEDPGQESEQEGVFLINKYLSKKSVVKLAYNELNNDKSIVNKALNKWNLALEEEKCQEEFIRKVKDIYVLTNYPKLRSFQFKFLYHAVRTNEHLYHFKIKSSQMCEFCLVEKETVRHLFFDCIYVRHIWGKVEKLLGREILYTNVVYCDRTCNEGSRSEFMLLLVKYYIFVQKCKEQIPTWGGCEKYVRDIKGVEGVIAQKNNKVSRHIAKWNNVNI